MRVTVRDDLKRMTACEHGGKSIEASETMPDVLDFSANFNAYLHPRIKSAIKQATQAAYQYPEHTYKRFRESVGAFLTVSSEAIVPGNGSVELIRLCAQALLEKGDKVIIPSPTFSEYEFACRLSGAKPVFVPLWDEHEFKQDLFFALADEGIKMVFLCNPNNPTGKILSRETVTEVAAQCRATHTFLFVDEVFIELSDPRQSLIQANLDDIFVLRSLTKSFSIPGIRVGYGVTNPAFAQELNAIRLPWNLNSIAEALTVALLEDSESYLEASRAKIATQRRWLVQELAKISGLEPLECDANFVMINVAGTSLTSSEFALRMKRYGYLIRDCSSFRLTGHDYIRIAVRKKAENARLLDAIKHVVYERG
jgi:threonine-phosphate decarboxylase